MAMSSLPTLPSIAKLSPLVTRILGQNPGPYTLQGTNTYLISNPSSSKLILLDTAAGLQSYLPLLRTALESHAAAFVKSSTNSQKPRHLSDIILSHWHEDHVGGLKGVLALLKELGWQQPRVWKFPAKKGEEAKDVEVEKILQDCVKSGSFSPPPTSSSSSTSSPSSATPSLLQSLKDGQIFDFGVVHEDRGEENASLYGSTLLEVVHTPGHTSDSISLLLTSSPPSSPSPTVLFTADTVLGHGTAVFENLSDYIKSLEKCVSRIGTVFPQTASSDMGDTTSVSLYPGHGDIIQKGEEKLKEYIKHRLERENQVVEALTKLKHEETGATATELTMTIYGSTIPESLYPAATRGLLLHLEKLLVDGKVTRVRPHPNSDTLEGSTATKEGEEKLQGDTTTNSIVEIWNDVWSLSSNVSESVEGGSRARSASPNAAKM